MYWAVHWEHPQGYSSAATGRVVMWHIKDGQTQPRLLVGNGSIDYVTMLPDPEASGLMYYYIEQGGYFAVNSMESAATSIAYFKKHLAHLL